MSIKNRQIIIRSLLLVFALAAAYRLVYVRGIPSYRPHRDETRSESNLVQRPPDESSSALTSKLSNISRDVSQATQDCIIRVVVRGHIVHFREFKPQNRFTRCPGVGSHGCKVSIVYSSDLSDILAANITFFSHLHRLPPLRDIRYLVQNRRENQRFALMSLETPLRVARNTTLPSSFGRSFYHWLATFSPWSDIPITYGRMLPVPHSGASPAMGNPFAGKTKLIAFISSNCIYTKWERLEFVHELQKHLPIDIYGRCGNLSCGDDENCTDVLRQYKFILALENSPCRGYISEKFWKTIWDYRSVAVVFGADREDYERYTPEGSFIFIESFRSFRSLAAHIREVASSEELYNSYHKWRESYRVELQDYWEDLPNDEHLCNAAERYVTDLRTNRPPRFRDTNRKDWIGSCRIKVHTKMEGFPIEA